MANTSRKNKGCLTALFQFISGNKDKVAEVEKTSDPLPFRVRDDFLSTAEHSFYMVLKTMMGTYFTICPKVSLSDIFYVINPDKNVSAYNRINRKHVDFLICDADTIKPRFGIELDDKSHTRQDRIERDEFVEELFETANLPLVRIPVRPTYNTNELGVLFKEALLKTLRPSQSAPKSAPIAAQQPEITTLPEPVEGNSGVDSTPALQKTQSGAQASSPTGEPPICPKCGQPMVLRVAGEGPNKGKRFWGCVNYPKCKVIIAKDF